MEILAVAAPPLRQEAVEQPAPGLQIRGAGVAAGSVVALALLSAILFTPLAYGEWLIAVCLAPQALFTAATAGCWVCAAVSAAVSEP